MKDIKNIIYKITLVIVTFSTVINFLFCQKVLSWDFVLVGFIMLMLCSIALNYVSIEERKNELIPFKKTPLIIILTIVICISWLISFCMTFSSK